MNPYLQVENLTKRIGDRTLFADVNFGIAERGRVALIARNGTGKTTLLNILAGQEGYDEGKITFRRDLRVGYLEQTPHFPPAATVLEACFGDDASEERQLKAKQMLSKLEITDFSRRVSTLSGGQLKRVALASVLISEPELLILDEPTNHLDLGMIEWLEGYLSRTTMALLMVTHDRYFLDRVCNTILELDGESLYTYRGNYSYYLEKRQERLDTADAQQRRAANLYRTELDWMRRMPCARGTKANYRKQAFYELEESARQRREEQDLKLQVKSAYIGKKIFEAEYVSKAFPGKVILKDFYYNFTRYEKMGIVGQNGTGKSTFVKMLLGLVKPDSGRFVVGETVKFGYFSQEPIEVDESMKVIDVVRRVAEYIDLGGGRHLTAMQFLQHFLFSPVQQQTYVYKLSGGERRRLQLCVVLMQNPNFLILDEPTNDLDIATLQVLEEYLRLFEGCVIVVSHDRYFMDKVVDHLLVFRGEGDVKDFPGNYSQYRMTPPQPSPTGEGGKKSAQTVKANNNTPSHVGEGRGVVSKRRLTFKERKEMEALEAEIETLEKEKKDIETALCSGTLSVDELTRQSKRLPVLEEELDEKSMRWLELSEYA